MPQPAAAVQIDRTSSASPHYVRYNVRDALGLVASIGVRADRDHPDLLVYLRAFYANHAPPAPDIAPAVVPPPLRASRPALRLHGG